MCLDNRLTGGSGSSQIIGSDSDHVEAKNKAKYQIQPKSEIFWKNEKSEKNRNISPHLLVEIYSFSVSFETMETVRGYQSYFSIGITNF